MIRGGMPREYRPTKLSELPKPQKIRPTKITYRMVSGSHVPVLFTYYWLMIYACVYGFIHADLNNSELYLGMLFW